MLKFKWRKQEQSDDVPLSEGLQGGDCVWAGFNACWWAGLDWAGEYGRRCGKENMARLVRKRATDTTTSPLNTKKWVLG